MKFDLDNKSFTTGIIVGVALSSMILGSALLAVKIINHQHAKQISNQIKMMNIKEAPLTQKETTSPTQTNLYNDHTEFVYEEYEQNQNQEVADIEAPLYVKHSQKIQLDSGKAKIAIVLDDLGVNVQNSQLAIDVLPKEITFAFLPYGKGTSNQIKQAYQAGHESMLHLPTEPTSSIDPGPNALLDSMSKEEIEKLTRYNINQLLDYIVGVNNHMGSKFTANQKNMEYVLKIVNENDLFFLDSFTTAKTKVSQAQQNIVPDMPLLRRNVFLDHKQTKQFIEGQLAKAESIAKTNGFSIAIGHPHKITIEVLNNWIKTLESKNIQLVPITNILELTKK